MKKRIKVKLPQISSRQEAADTVATLAQIVNRQLALCAEMDKKILAIKEDYASKLAALEGDAAVMTEIVRGWAESHPEEFPKNKKSIEFADGTIGFRTGTPKLALLNRSWNWDKVLAAVQHLLPNFIRSKPEVDKEAILGQREDEAIQYALPRCGMKIVQDESFFIDPKLTPVETRQTAEAA